MRCILGIDTSNYTTSVAFASEQGEILLQKKQLLPVAPGQRGLRQSDAVFHHVNALPTLLHAAFEELPAGTTLCAVGVSERPRSVEGSYMPCFLSGLSVAVAASEAAHVPLYRFSHQEGHIAAAAYASGLALNVEKPFLAFHLSGGTTELLHVTVNTDTVCAERIGGSKDLSAGQAIDRTAVLLGLPFPGGAQFEALAAHCSPFPKAGKISVDGLDCSLSGIENRVKQMLAEQEEPSRIAAFVFANLEKTILTMTEHAMLRYPGYSVLFAGGVMSSRLMRPALARVCPAYFADGPFASDNAAGVALLATRCLHDTEGKGLRP